MSSAANDSPVDAAAARRLIGALERAAAANALARAKHAGALEAVGSSEVALHDAVAALGPLATDSGAYAAAREAGVVRVLAGLLSHENVDIVADVLGVLVDFVDPDGEDDDGEHRALVEELVEEGGVSAVVDLVRERLAVTGGEAADEEDKEVLGSAALAAMSVFENAVELRPDLAEVLGGRCGIVGLCVEELRAGGGFSERRASAAEVLALLLQSSMENRRVFGKADGMEAILTALGAYLRAELAHGDEEEMVANMFGVLCAAVLELEENQEAFRGAEGVELMILFVRKRKMFREPALKALDFACSGSRKNTQRIFEGSGVGVLFAVLMSLWTSTEPTVEQDKERRKRRRTTAPSDVQRSETEHSLSVIFSLYRYSSEMEKARLTSKFGESAGAKARQLLVIYTDRLEDGLRNAGTADSVAAMDDDLDPSEAYVLQLCAIVVAHVCISGGQGLVKAFENALDTVGGLARVSQLVERFSSGMDEEKNAAERRRLMALSESIDQLLLKSEGDKDGVVLSGVEEKDTGVDKP